MSENAPVRLSKCGTCPFRAGSPYAYLADDLTQSSVTESRICHSTGANNAINKRTGIKPYICRGSRDFQLRFMAAAGIIAAPTDEAWNAMRKKIGMRPQVIEDPKRRK